jgi:predicted Ser/Thr protein kinase
MTHPQRLGKYPITGVIGEGAMGVVYKGVDPVIQRPVAIKTIHRQLVHDDDPTSSFVARFRNEAQAVGRLSHPSIVAIYEYGEDEDTAYIAMEYVEGRNLSQLLASTPLPSDAVIVHVMDQLLSALACAHDAGVWHRDIKPANLIVTAGGQVKVTDFGIARIENQQLTQVTSVIGTPGYIAPEQYTGAPLDHRVDLFAAGVLMYRMLTGNSPFAGSAEMVMYKTVHETPLPPSEASGGRRSTAFDAVVAKAIAKKPEERHASAAAFREALLLAAGRAHAAGPPSPPSMGRGTAPAPFEPTQAATHSSAGSVLSASSVGGWDTAELAPIELALATVLGPMAKLLVRQAARNCSDMATLAARVAEHITDAKERDAFLKRVATVPNLARPAATAAPAVTTSPPLTDPGGVLPSAVISHALRVMTVHIGPIARIVVKKAAVQAQTTDEFYALLADQAGDGVDKRRVLKLLRSRMD